MTIDEEFERATKEFDRAIRRFNWSLVVYVIAMAILCLIFIDKLAS